MDNLRTPFYVAALILVVLSFGLEIGAHWFMPPGMPSETQIAQLLEQRPGSDPAALKAANEAGARPGFGITCLAILDALLLCVVVLFGTALILPQSLHGRLQAVVLLIVSAITAISGIVSLVLVFGTLMLMLGLLLAPPFGTIAYLAMWGFFDRGSASITLGAILLFKLAAAVCLVIAQPRFLANKSLVVLVLMTLLTTVIVSFLHGLVPGFLVSITDAVAALLVGLIGVIWAVLALVFSIISVLKGLRVRVS